MIRAVIASVLVVGTSALAPGVYTTYGMRSVQGVRRAVQPSLIAKTSEERALLAASKKVTQVARKFGYTQGAAAQEWVEQAVKTKDANSATLMEMQLTLFDECSVDDESGRCKALSEAIDAMKAAVDKKGAVPTDTKKKGFKLNLGPSEMQKAADKVRDAATRFGPSQKEAANAWIKQVTVGTDATAVSPAYREDLLTQKITLFGECLLSEDGTPSDCEQLDQALTEFQEAIEFCDIASAAAEEACRAAEVLAQLKADYEAGKCVSWYDRGVRLEPAPPAPPAAAASTAAKSASTPAAAPATADPPGAKEATGSLMMACRKAAANVGDTSALVMLERAIAVAKAADADAEKVRVAVELVERKGRAAKAGAAPIETWYK